MNLPHNIKSKFVIVILILLCLTLVSAGCGFSRRNEVTSKELSNTRNTISGWLTYRSHGGELTFQYPPDWKIQQEQYRSAGDFMLQLDHNKITSSSGFVFDVIISYWNSTNTLFCTSISKCINEDDLVGIATTTIIGGMPAIRGVINVAPYARTPSLAGEINIPLSPNHGFNISYSPYDDEDPLSVQIFDSILSTFRFSENVTNN